MTSKITKKAFHVPPPSRQEVSMQNHTGKNAFRFSLSILAAAILATTSVTAFAADVAAGTGAFCRSKQLHGKSQSDRDWQRCRGDYVFK